MAGRARHKKRRVVPQDEAAAHRRFMEALEAQRSNARNQAVETCSENKTALSPAPLPGFYYDEVKGRYFRSSPTSERRRRALMETQQQERDIAVHNVDTKVKNRRFGYGANGHNWVGYLSQRQSDFAWSACGRDRREMVPQLMSGFLSSLVVEVQNLNIHGRYTALSLHPHVSDLGAVGASSGMVDVLGLQKSSPGVRTSQLAHSLCCFELRGFITSLQWRPVQGRELLACHLGFRSGSMRSYSGNVCFIQMSKQETRPIALVTTARVTRTKFVDPWTAIWNPTDSNKFSVGCGGSSTAAYVDAAVDSSDCQLGPSGLLTSAVHAQSFFSTGPVVVNGTRCEGLWGWDVRAPRRIFEQEAETTAGVRRGSVLDIHVLKDCFRAIVQRSNGELRIVDLRTFKPVVEFMPGATKRYLSDLRCAIDSSESVVVAGGDAKYPRAVNSYDLSSGRRIASLEAKKKAQIPQERSTLVQQVQLRSGHYGSRYEDVWAISRSDLYAWTENSW